jgi:hypothetical protein
MVYIFSNKHKGGELTQALYAHMNKIKIKIKKKQAQKSCVYKTHA